MVRSIMKYWRKTSILVKIKVDQLVAKFDQIPIRPDTSSISPDWNLIKFGQIVLA